MNESTSNEPKPSSDSPSDPPNTVAHTTDGRPIVIKGHWSPWALPYGDWARRARIG